MSTFLTCQVKRIRVGAGLPNIMGRFVASSRVNNFYADGAFYDSLNSLNHRDGTTSNVYGFGAYYFDASRSSSVYGNSGTVSPLSKSTLYVMKY